METGVGGGEGGGHPLSTPERDQNTRVPCSPFNWAYSCTACYIASSVWACFPRVSATSLPGSPRSALAVLSCALSWLHGALPV